MNILVSGAGLAGLSLALDLGRHGHHVTVVERANHFRVNGSPIDVRGDAIDIADRMGLLGKIEENRVSATELSVFVDADGREIGRMPVNEFDDSDHDLEIAREDLARIMIDALPPSTTIRLREHIESLADDGAGVDVRFASGGTGRFDLVLGADGQHSAVRRLAFGPEQDYLLHLGLYVALAELPGEEMAERLNPVYNFPGHMATIWRYKNKALAGFAFRSDLVDYDHHDLDAQKKILIDAFAGHTEWKIPQLLDAASADPEFYFDSVSQIRMPSWHRGRIALVGDAAACATLLSGRGTSLALTGAWFLAEELDRAGDDHTVAFQRYETRQRPYVDFAQNSVGDTSELLVPTSWESIDARTRRITGADTAETGAR